MHQTTFHKSNIMSGQIDLSNIPLNNESASKTHRLRQLDKNAPNQRNQGLGILSPFSPHVHDKFIDKRKGASTSVNNLVKVSTPFDKTSKLGKVTGTSLA